jgi:putative flippase GtrA
VRIFKKFFFSRHTTMADTTSGGGVLQFLRFFVRPLSVFFLSLPLLLLLCWVHPSLTHARTHAGG